MTKPQRRMLGGLNGDRIIVDDAKSASNGKVVFGINGSNHSKDMNSAELESSILFATLAEELS